MACMMQVIVSILLALPGMLSCAPLEPVKDQSSTAQYIQRYLIDGVQVSKLPERFRDIAVMCDVYKKINDPTNNRIPEFKVKGLSSEEIPEDSDISISEKHTKDNSFQGLHLSEDVMGRLNEIKSDVHTMGVKDTDIEQASRKERVRRAELSKLFEGVCLTDACLQVLKEYLEWRRENGYPVYTGVTQIGK